MGRVRLAFVFAAFVLSLVVPASANAGIFPVNTTADANDANVGGSFNGTCATSAGQCTLRAAIQEANASSGGDTINFDGSVFNGSPGGTITVNNSDDGDGAGDLGPLPLIDSFPANDPVSVNGCSAAPNHAGPCVGLRLESANANALGFGSPNSSVSGIAVTNASQGLFIGTGASEITVTNSWFGIKLDGTVEANTTGVTLSAANSQIGGTAGATGTAPATRNVFAGNGSGLTIFGGSNNTVLGNYFGTNPSGEASAGFGNIAEAIAVSSGASTASNNVIGTVTGGAGGTQECDGGCNLIVGSTGGFVGFGTASGPGIDLANELGGGFGPGAATTIKGNHIGVARLGTATAPNAGAGILVGTANGTVIGGDTAGDGNLIGGNGAGNAGIGVSPGGGGIQISGDDSFVQGNLIGTNSQGDVLGNVGPGVLLGNGANSNRVGADSTLGEAPNVISNNGGDAIRILGGANTFGNRVDENRGRDNGAATDPFIDIGSDGVGNSDGTQAGVQAPVITNVIDNAGPTSTVQGSGQTSATIRIYTTSTNTGRDIRKMLNVPFSADPTTGDWSYTMPDPPPQTCLAANQTTNPGLNGSELSNVWVVGGGTTCDTTPPGPPTITSGPSGPTNDSTPTFGFSSDPGATFECRVDSGIFAPCDNPGPSTGDETTSSLADGPHTFQVRATDGLGDTGPAASRSFSVDTTAPGAPGITGGPTRPTNDNTPTFTFTGEGPDFSCQIDGGAPAECDSGTFTPGALADGSHSFSVTTTDAAGNHSTAASRSFSVDTDRPNTRFKRKPARQTEDRTPTFRLASDEPGSTFQCKLDRKKFRRCGRKLTTKKLALGAHKLRVRAIDPAGNVDSTPAVAKFQVVA